MEQTSEALSRIASAALQWSAHPNLTRSQHAMARTLQRRSAQLAAAPVRSSEDVDGIKPICCHLYAAVNGVKPEPRLCPLELCNSGEAKF